MKILGKNLKNYKIRKNGICIEVFFFFYKKYMYNKVYNIGS